MEDLRRLLEETANGSLLTMVISGARKKTGVQKIKVRPTELRGRLIFQAGLWDGTQDRHQNLDGEELIDAVVKWMEQDFRQIQIDTTQLSASALVSKKGKVTIRKRVLNEKREAPVLSHNRKKQYILEEGIPVPFLVELGVMTPEGRVVNSRYDKFRQINRFLEFIEDICPYLPGNRELTMIDFGCGKSYLTFAMYYYLREIRGLDLRIIGLDLKEEVIRHCNELAGRFGYEKLQFLTGDIADYEGVDRVDLVVTLHACDTATDHALAKAVKWNARAILSVPCCQHELNRQMENDILEPVLQYGILKERMAALITDGLRAGMLEQQGYQVQVLEFIDMEHTPKNILIRAVKRRGGNKRIALRDGKETCLLPGENGQEKDAGYGERIQKCMDFLGVDPMLYHLLKGGE